jgi:uncharacterized protein
MRLTHPRRDPLALCPRRDDALLIDWLRPLWPENRPEPDRLVVAPTVSIWPTRPIPCRRC